MSHVDVLIITALPEEFDAAQRAANGVTAWREHDTGGPRPYLTGEFRTGSGAVLSVALARPTSMGPRPLGPFATTLTNLLRPTCLAMCGVCAGSPDDTAPGDVVVAQRVYEHDAGKWTAGVFRADHEKYRQQNPWVRAAQDFDPDGLPSYGRAAAAEAGIWYLERLYRGQNPRAHPAFPRYFPRGTWTAVRDDLASRGLIFRRDVDFELTDDGRLFIARVLADDVDGPDKLPFAVLTGPMASGNAVIQDEKIWDRLKDLGERKILALEMEGATIATVADDLDVPHWLVAKGVMDNADLAKDDRFKEFAARASAEVLFALLARLLPGPGPARPEMTSGAVRLRIIQRLGPDWQSLADLAGVQPYERAAFPRGDEPRRTLEWLELRARSGELPELLTAIGRSDLASLIRR